MAKVDVREAKAKLPKRVKVRGSPTTGLASAAVSFFVGFASVSLFGPTVHKVGELLGLTAMQSSWLIAMPTLSGSLLRIPCGAYADSVGARKPILYLLGISIVGMIGLTCLLSRLEKGSPASVVYPCLLLLSILCGCGIGTFSSGVSQVSYWFPQQSQGKALGLYAGLGTLSPGLATLAVPHLLNSIGLVRTYLVWLAILVAGTIFYFSVGHNAWYYQLRDAMPQEEAQAMARKYGQELFPKGSAFQGLVTAAKVWKTWALVSSYFVNFGGLVALTGWLPTYWHKLHGFKPTQAGALTAIFSLLGPIIRVPGGYVSDLLGGEKSLMLSLGVVATGASLLMSSEAFDTCLAGTIIIAMGMGVANAATFKLVPQEVPQAVGGAAGWVGGGGCFGGFALTPAMAYFVKAYGRVGYSRGFGIFVALAVVAFGASGALLCSKLDSEDSDSETDSSDGSYESLEDSGE